jgi:cob(I)alamin adenosyltransferase
MFQVYTGNGKGKTSASIGVAVRALGNNQRVIFISFFKKKVTGEEKIFKKQKNLTYKKFGTKDFVYDVPTEKQRTEIKKGITYLNNILDKNNKIDLLVLDEFNLVIFYKLIELKEVINVINICKKRRIELVFTGRNANKKIIQLADLVSDIKEVKHYYNRGIKFRKGIEY